VAHRTPGPDRRSHGWLGVRRHLDIH
jgi:hypothetical protein